MPRGRQIEPAFANDELFRELGQALLTFPVVDGLVDARKDGLGLKDGVLEFRQVWTLGLGVVKDLFE